MALTMNNKPIPAEEDPNLDSLTFNKVFAMFQENDRIMKEASQKMNMLTEQMGGLRRSFGEMAEHVAAQNIEERVNEQARKKSEPLITQINLINYDFLTIKIKLTVTENLCYHLNLRNLWF